MKFTFDLFTINRYYRMSDHELEMEASKYKIGGYSDGRGVIRERIIDQLIKKDQANSSRVAIFMSIIAIVISVVALFV
jgi:hypothetical protein